MSKPKIGVIVGSIRANRFAERPAQWIAELARASGELDVEIIDLKDYPLPIFDEAVSPAYGTVSSEVALRWQKKLDEQDGFIFTAAEYTRGPTAALKNAIDYAYPQWNKKVAAYVGYGGVGGARAIEQLRLNAIEDQMVPIRNAVHIMFGEYLAIVNEGKSISDFPHLQQAGQDMIAQLTWYVKALKAARDADTAATEAASEGRDHEE
ncbi:NADPH-dependent FMN reductase [Tianweitania populi]|uniref:FMN reductase n=1 Tax=Tianweitania populi TaxID=1607949 RepID=A0A8J3DUM3_9HYPH|nr:NAD(P)H-dependent oxidoreductase [Tianweitania populi]GHD11580.1 FMN reductase [Tianweitania populi]